MEKQERGMMKIGEGDGMEDMERLEREGWEEDR